MKRVNKSKDQSYPARTVHCDYLLRPLDGDFENVLHSGRVYI